MATPRIGRRRRLLASLFILAGLVVLVILSLALAMNVWGVAQVAAAIESAQPWLLIWRVAFCTGIVALWPALVDRLRPWITDTNASALRAARIRVALWLVAIEVVLIQGFPGRLLGWILS